MRKKKDTNWLRVYRIGFALFFFLLITVYLVDFTNRSPRRMLQLAEYQFVPAVLSGFIVAWVITLLITLVFGRLYCSTLCPAGVLQDIFIRISRMRFWHRDKKKKKIFFHYQQPQNLLRYGLLTATVISFLLGFSSLLVLFDPYSNYGRVSANILRPFVTTINNLVAKLAGSGSTDWLVHADINTVSLAALTGSLIFFVGIFITSALHGRLFCNTLCPAGSTLSLVSRYSLFKIKIDESVCNSCGNCTRSCKAECINFETKEVDNSRCVTCFNCISNCNRGGLHYRLTNPFVKKADHLAGIPIVNQRGRRIFFSTLGTILSSIALIPSIAQQHRQKGRSGPVDHLDPEKREGYERIAGNDTALLKHRPPKPPEGVPGQKHHLQDKPITPPGSGDLEHFLQYCTGCHLCVVKCPDQILKPVGLNYGVTYFLKPEMLYTENFCNYECTDCLDVCPTDALMKITLEKKQTTQLGKVHFKEDLCVVKTDNTDCGACSEHCPTQAVKMVPYKGALTIPEINNDLCVGCGGCEHICPVRPKRAIFIVANPVHLAVKKPELKELKQVDNLDFGF